MLAYCQGKSRQDIASGLQDELDRMHDWCEEYNGKLHPDKASVLWCTLNNRAVKDDMPEVSIAGKVIKRDHSLRYLGIVFDRSLSGNEHAQGPQSTKCLESYGLYEHATDNLADSLSNFAVVCSGLWHWFADLVQNPSRKIGIDPKPRGMRTILGCTRNTSCEAMRHLLDLLSMPERHKKAQVQAYLKVSADVNHPLHNKVGREVQSRLKRGTEWMNQASRTMSQCCDVRSIRRGET